MNKVRHSIVYSVVVTLMAQRQAVINVVAQFGMVLNFFDVVSLQLAVASAMLAGVVVALQHFQFPPEIFGTSSALILLFVFALGDSLTLHPAVGVSARAFARPFGEDLAANIAGKLSAVSATSSGAIRSASNVRGRTRNLSSARNADDGHFLRLRRGRARAGAVTLFRVFIPVSIPFFGDDRSADFAWFQRV
jgi:hypothetical protein